jgi:hypothetical protein
MKLPFRATRRRAILDRYFALLPQAEAAAGPELLALADEYEEGLPTVGLSRCPFTQLELRHSFDSFGLDGLWWDATAPRRPLLERLYTCQALTGAVSLRRPVERFPFLAKPGPGLPYVIPEVLRHPQVKAVVSAHRVGAHAAFCVAYFAPDELDGVDWPNDWATDRRWATGGQSGPGWHEAAPDGTRWDFQLSPWIESGKLLWIAPGDEDLTLRGGAAGCPYLGLRGEARMQRVQDGEVWFSEEVDEFGLEESAR